MNYAPLTLTFKDKELEKKYIESSFARVKIQGRVAIVIGFLIYVFWGVLDYWYIPEDILFQAWSVRFTVLLAPILVFIFSFSNYFFKYHSQLLALVGFAAGLGTIGVQSLLTSDILPYYPMIILATFFTYNFIGARFIHAFLVDLSIIILYNAVFISLDYPMHTLFTHNFYIISANLIGGSAGYLNELQKRKLFLQEEQLIVKNHHKDLLLKEVFHRVKNNLQVISNLFYLKSKEINRENPKETFDESRKILKTISLLHEKIYRFDNIETINMQEYLQELIDEIRSSFALQMLDIQLRCHNTILKIDEATPLGLIINELMTNSFKHGFLETKKKNIVIYLKNEEDELKLYYQDNGQGFDENDLKKGFGLNLIEQLSTYELKAQCNYFDQNGFHFTLIKEGAKE